MCHVLFRPPGMRQPHTLTAHNFKQQPLRTRLSPVISGFGAGANMRKTPPRGGFSWPPPGRLPSSGGALSDAPCLCRSPANAQSWSGSLVGVHVDSEK